MIYWQLRRLSRSILLLHFSIDSVSAISSSGKLLRRFLSTLRRRYHLLSRDDAPSHGLLASVPARSSIVEQMEMRWWLGVPAARTGWASWHQSNKYPTSNAMAGRQRPLEFYPIRSRHEIMPPPGSTSSSASFLSHNLIWFLVRLTSVIFPAVHVRSGRLCTCVFGSIEQPSTCTSRWTNYVLASWRISSKRNQAAWVIVTLQPAICNRHPERFHSACDRPWYLCRNLSVSFLRLFSSLTSVTSCLPILLSPRTWPSALQIVHTSDQVFPNPVASRCFHQQ